MAEYTLKNRSNDSEYIQYQRRTYISENSFANEIGKTQVFIQALDGGDKVYAPNGAPILHSNIEEAIQQLPPM